jgi:flagellar motor switch protein FliN
MSTTDHDRTLAEGLCRHFAAAVSTLLGGSSIAVSAEPPSEGWQIRLAVDGRGLGSLWIGLTANDAAAIAKRILGVDEEPAEGMIRDTLRELAAQAATGVQLEPIGAGLNIRVEAVETTFQGVPAEPAGAWGFDLGDGTTVALAGWSAVRIDEGAPVREKRINIAGAEAFARPASTGSETLDMILDIDLPMSVRFGRTELALGALTRLGPGSVIGLGRSPDEPVEVLVSGRVVARGDVVVVGGNFGVRITDVVHAMGARRF